MRSTTDPSPSPTFPAECSPAATSPSPTFPAECSPAATSPSQHSPRNARAAGTSPDIPRGMFMHQGIARPPATLATQLALFRRALEAARNQRCPAGLVACAEAAAGLAMEVFVEQHEVLPVGIARVARIVAVARAAAVAVGQEHRAEAACELARDLGEVHEVAGAGRAFDLERVAVEVMITLERFDQQVVDREPDRPSPVGVAAE